MAIDSKVTITEWLEARNIVSTRLKNISPSSQTSVRQAEDLISVGYVDIDAVLAQPRARREREAAEKAKREAEAEVAAKTRQAELDRRERDARAGAAKSVPATEPKEKK